MSLKHLVNLEYINWKKRIRKENSGCHIVIYWGLGFSVFASSLFGYKMDEDFLKVLIMLCSGIFLLYQSATICLSSVKEKGRRVNIFEKYVYTPVDFKLLRRAKMIVMAKILAWPILLSQSAAVLIRVIDPDKDGGSILDLNVWIPFIIAVVFFVYKDFEYRRLCKKALKR